MYESIREQIILMRYYIKKFKYFANVMFFYLQKINKSTSKAQINDYGSFHY